MEDIRVTREAVANALSARNQREAQILAVVGATSLMGSLALWFQ
jgi:hypothetical protein